MLYFSQGSALVTAEELFHATSFGRLTDFYKDLSKGIKPEPLAFSTGELNADNFVKGIVTGPEAELVEFKPIGVGKPLTVQIRGVYTGQYPKGAFGGVSKKDMLVTSATKSITIFEAKPLALNFLMDKISSKSHISQPPASRQGTPFVYYSPALLQKSLTIDLSIVFDTFPQAAFEAVGNLFSQAAGVPIFLSYNVYLIAAGMVTRLMGQAGEKFFDGAPVFQTSDSLDIYWPGKPPLPPGFLLVTSGDADRVDPNFRRDYRVDGTGKVVDKAGKEYGGDVPFIVISLDGTPQEDLVSFEPTAASAALLSRFFGIKDGQQQPLSQLVDAMKVYNDLYFRQQVDRLDAQLAGLPDGDPCKGDLQTRRDALAANILEELLKPKKGRTGFAQSRQAGGL